MSRLHRMFGINLAVIEDTEHVESNLRNQYSFFVLWHNKESKQLDDHNFSER